MAIVIILVTAVPIYALAFTVVTYILGIFSENFRPTEATFLDIFKSFLIIAAIYLALLIIGLNPGMLPLVVLMMFTGTILGLAAGIIPLVSGLIGLVILTAAYKHIFGATWQHALIISFIGGFVGTLIWMLLIDIALAL